MAILSKLFGKNKKQQPVVGGEKVPYLTQTVVFGMHRYRTANEDSTVYFVDEARGIRKMLVDRSGKFQRFPGIVREESWAADMNPRDLQPQIRYRTSFSKKEGKWLLLWQVQPDGRYWEDEDGFGGTNDEEVILYTYVNMDGDFTGPFRIYSLGCKCFLPEA